MSGGLSSGRANPLRLTAPVDPGLVERRAGGGSEGLVALMPVALFDEHRSHVNAIGNG